MKKELATEQYEELKTVAISNEPLTKRVNLGDIGLEKNSVKDQFIIINKQPIAVENSFFNDLTGILNINSSLSKSLRNNKDDFFFNAIIEALKTYKVAHGKDKERMVTIVGDANLNGLTGLYKGEYKRLSNKGLFETAEQLVNDYGLIPTNVTGDGTSKTGVAIQLLSPKDLGFNINEKLNNEEEVFNFGLVMQNSYGQTKLGDFSYRLVCANGMMGMKTYFNYTLESLSGSHLKRFSDHIDEYAKKDFVPIGWNEKLTTASETPASLREVELAYDIVTKQIQNDSKDEVAYIQQGLRENWFKGIGHAWNRLAKQDHDPTSLSNDQKKFVKTNMSIWEVINNITYLGSNSTGIKFKSESHLLKSAGKMFSQTFDLSNAAFMDI